MVGSAGDLVLRDGGVSSFARYVSVASTPFIFSTGKQGGKKTETNQIEVTNKIANLVWGGGGGFGNKKDISSCRTSLMYRAT